MNGHRVTLIVYIVTIVVILGGATLAANDVRPFSGTFVLGNEVWEIEGQAELVGTTTPIAGTPSPMPIDTDTPVPTNTPVSNTKFSIGANTWGYLMPVFLEHDQDKALISVMVPSQMTSQSITYQDLISAGGFAGPVHGMMSALRTIIPQAAQQGANVVAYTPEGLATCPQCDPYEVSHQAEFVQEFVSLAQQNNLIPVYGSSFDLLVNPDTWNTCVSWDLNTDLVSELAALMPDNGHWVVRMHTAECKYGPTQEYRDAAMEYINAINAGNPNLTLHLHVASMAGSEEDVISYFELMRDQVDSGYMATHPTEDQEGTISTLNAVLDHFDWTDNVPPTPVPSITPTPSTPVQSQVIENIPYADGERHVFDLYLPAGTGPFPVVAWFHGGGMSAGEKGNIWDQCQHMQDAGIACVAPNYTLVPNAWLPTQIHEAKAVIRAIKALASQYNLDPGRVGITGGSAGAILAVAVGTSDGVEYLEGNIGPYLDQSSAVTCFLGNAGIYDFSGCDDGKGYYSWRLTYCEGKPLGNPVCQEQKLFGCDMADPPCHDRIDQSGGFKWISEGDPPGALVVGDQDQTPNWNEDHTSFHNAMLNAGNQSGLTILPGIDHYTLWPNNWPYILNHFNSCLQ